MIIRNLQKIIIWKIVKKKQNKTKRYWTYYSYIYNHTRHDGKKTIGILYISMINNLFFVL